MFAESFADATKEAADNWKAWKKGERLVLDLKDMQFGNSFTNAGKHNLREPGIIELPKRKAAYPRTAAGRYHGTEQHLWFRERDQRYRFDRKRPWGHYKSANRSGIDRIQRLRWMDCRLPGYFPKYARRHRGYDNLPQSRLPELLLRAEDAQILDGNGVRPNLLGIQSAGNYTAAAAASANRAETLVNAISQLENLDREANGILLNPADWYTLWLYKGSTSGEYTLPVNLIERTAGGGMVIAGVPVFKSTAQRLLTTWWVTGQWVQTSLPGSLRVEFFYEDSTNVRSNQVTVRIEERVALPVYGNDYFVYGTFWRCFIRWLVKCIVIRPCLYGRGL